jgi:O-acetyl-ADP-ribose deacetylase (regulator of RNase III)
VEIEVLRGDIAKQRAGAIVNAANNHLWMGAGVAGALKRAGGVEIEAEAMAKGPVAVGEAVVTGAGRLAADHVIHAAVMGQDLLTDAATIRCATRSSLERAMEIGAGSVAFPALGTGVGGFPIGECARLMVDEVRRFASDGVRRLSAADTTLERVVFVLYDAAAYRAFSDALQEEAPEVSG